MATGAETEWTLVADGDLAAGDMLSRWVEAHGRWTRTAEGLCKSGADPATLLMREPLVWGASKFEYAARSEDLGDLTLVPDSDDGVTYGAVLIGIGAGNRVANAAARNDRVEPGGSRPAKDPWHGITVLREGGRLAVLVDGRPVLGEPNLHGYAGRFLGLCVYANGTFRSLRVFRRADPHGDEQARLPDSIEVRLPAVSGHPFLACTAAELARIRSAYRGREPAHEAVAQVADPAIQRLAQLSGIPLREWGQEGGCLCPQCHAPLKAVEAGRYGCSRCNRIYSGSDADLNAYALKAMHDAAMAWAVTERAEFAEYAAAMLLGAVARYPACALQVDGGISSPRAFITAGRLFRETLGEAQRMTTQIAPAFDLICRAGVLSEQDRAAIRANLITPMLQTIGKHVVGPHNFQTWHNAAMLWGGALLGDPSWVDRAIDDPCNGFLFQMRESLSREGVWYEKSWGYHVYALRGLARTAEGAWRLGMDLWRQEPLLKMLTVIRRGLMPDGQAPRFGDSEGNSGVSGLDDLMEPAWHATGDARLLPSLSAKPNWYSVLLGRDPAKTPAPARGEPLRSEIWPDAGYAILRTQGAANLTAAISFGSHGGFHGHGDKLSFVLSAYGMELGHDSGKAPGVSYADPVHLRWYRETLSHNTVVADRVSQQRPPKKDLQTLRAASGRLHAFAATDTRAMVLASCDVAYPGVRHRRLLYLTPSWLLVHDDLLADADRRFDWCYHNLGERVVCEVAAEKTEPEDGYPGMEYVQDLWRGTTRGPVGVLFSRQDVLVHLTLAGGPETAVNIGYGPGAFPGERVPLAMMTRRGRAVGFSAVLEPVPAGQAARVSEVTRLNGCPDLAIAIQEGAMHHTVRLSPDDGFRAAVDGRSVLQANLENGPRNAVV